MAKTKPKKNSKKRDRSILNGTTVPRKPSAPRENPTQLLSKATELLQTSQADEALALALRALSVLEASSSRIDQLPTLNLIAEINIELGDATSASQYFLRAVDIDPDGAIPEISGGGSEKFLWLAQLSEEGGHDSVKWFERGVRVLKTEVVELESTDGVEEVLLVQDKKMKLSKALCGVIEIYMTDLSWEDDAETRCEALITEALLFSPNSPETLQTLASVRISQLRLEDARAALTRSLDLWKDLPPEDPAVPDFPSKISLSRLLMEAEMEDSALDVLERLVEEDDSSVEAWYLGGWCLYLLGEKQQKGDVDGSRTEVHENTENAKASHVASRIWLNNSLKLYQMFEYEDERLKEHAQELVDKLDEDLGDAADEAESEEEGDWEEEDSDDEKSDENMNGI